MILITRLKDDNSYIKKKLKNENIKIVSNPLYKVSYIKKKIESDSKKIFILASQHAIQIILNKKNFSKLKNSTFFVIGTKSASQLRKFGVKVQLEGKDSKDLLYKIKKNKHYKKSNFEYLCSNKYNKLLVKDLRNYNKIWK